MWYWLTVLDTFRYTGMRLNQLLHIRLREVNLSEDYMDLCLQGSKTRREWRVPVVRALKPRLRYLIARSVELKMDIVGKTLEAELALHTDLTTERNLQLLTQA